MLSKFAVTENSINRRAREDKALRDPDACNAYVRERVGEGRHYVMIDEVQLMPEFEDVLLGFLHIPNLDVYVTGSNSKFLSSDIITEFRGWGDQVCVHPLSFAEYHSAMGRDWDDDWDDYQTATIPLSGSCSCRRFCM